MKCSKGAIFEDKNPAVWRGFWKAAIPAQLSSCIALDHLSPALGTLGIDFSFIRHPSSKMSHEMQRSWTLQEPAITQRVDVHGHTMAFNEAIRDFIFQDRDTRSPFPPAEDLEAWLKDDEVAAWKRFSFCKPTWEGVGAFLGPGPHESGCHPILNVFSYNLFHPAISVGMPVINTVEDVKRDFYQNFEYMVRSGFSTGPFMTSRSDVPVDTTLPTESCIYRLTWPRRIDQLHEKSAMIGLFRKPGTIKPSQWEGSLGGLNLQIDASTRKLQQNIREYVSRISFFIGSVIFQPPLLVSR